MSDHWPDDDALLMLVRESREHDRAWRLIRGLSNKLLEERTAVCRGPGKLYEKPVGPKPGGWNDKLRELETKVVAQKAQLRRLEECREFEAETERLLVAALVRMRDAAYPEGHLLQALAVATLEENVSRHGPRPK